MVLIVSVGRQEELERLALSNIRDLHAVMDSGVYDSLLTLSVQDRQKKTTSVFMFQCEELRVRTVQPGWECVTLEFSNSARTRIRF